MTNRRRSSTIKSALSSLLGHDNGRRHSTTSMANEKGKRRHTHANIQTSSGSASGSGSASASGTNNSTTGAAAGSTINNHTSPQSPNHNRPLIRATSPDFRGEDRRKPSMVDDDGSVLEFDDGSVHSDALKYLPESFNKEYLAEYLRNRGFLHPKPVLNRDDFSIGVATSGDVVFLPTVSTNDDEYLARLNGLRGESNNEIGVDDMDDVEQQTPTSANSNSNGNQNSTSGTEMGGRRAVDEYLDMQRPSNGNSSEPGSSSSQRRPSGSATNRTIEMDASMVSFSVAVILSVKNPMKLSDVKVELCSRIRIYWHAGVPPTKTFFEEFYQAGYINWCLNDTNYDVYIPSMVSPDMQIIERQNNRQVQIFKNKPIEERFYTDKNRIKAQFLDELNNSRPQMLEPGNYVFLLPVIFSNHVPETTYLPSARVSYKLKVGTKCLDTSVKRSLSSSSLSHNTSLNIPISTASSTSSLASLKDMESDVKGLSSSPPHKGVNLFKKVKNHLHLPNNHQAKLPEIEEPREMYSEYSVKVIRTPPPISISTANKPIYINRVWSDALSYEISFASKYVSLNSKVPIKIKLAPIAKNIFVKRVRVSITEKVTFVSKNLEYEYDQIDPVAKDPYNPYYLDFTSKRRKERNLALLEVRTKEKGSRALREEIVDNCTNDNLLSFGSVKDDKNKGEEIPIVEPITMETTLDFPSFLDLDKKSAKVIPPYGIDVYTGIANPELQQATHHKTGVLGVLANIKNSTDSNISPSKSSSSSDRYGNNNNINLESAKNKNLISKFHQTKFKVNSQQEILHHTKLNRCKRGLYLDSLHYTNIHVRHKLEVMLRISKPDPENPAKLRHYEVLIDTPVFLVSEQCNTGNMELPTYDMATTTTTTEQTPLPNAAHLSAPPTFEEAISVPASPIGSPIGSPVMSPSYDPELLSIQQLNLSRSTSFSGPSIQLDAASGSFDYNSGNGLPKPGSHRPSISAEASSGRFSNLDRIMATQMSSPPALPRDLLQIRRPSDTAMSPRTSTPTSPTSRPLAETNPFFKKDYSLTTKATNEDGAIPPHATPSKDPPTYEEAVL
ncbi:Ecm21p [Nakaseomyces bracarensis]|uniref:Ecm21p n=1 Tax=Nakaseomyces bracarensis TaxID=273131 RepID=UPI003870EF46